MHLRLTRTPSCFCQPSLANTDSACVYLVRRFHVVYVPLLQIAFWTLAYILSHPDLHRTIVESISSVFGTAGTKLIYIIKDAFSMYGFDLECLPCFKIREQDQAHGSVDKMMATPARGPTLVQSPVHTLKKKKKHGIVAHGCHPSA